MSLQAAAARSARPRADCRGALLDAYAAATLTLLPPALTPAALTHADEGDYEPDPREVYAAVTPFNLK